MSGYNCESCPAASTKPDAILMTGCEGPVDIITVVGHLESVDKLVPISAFICKRVASREMVQLSEHIKDNVESLVPEHYLAVAESLGQKVIPLEDTSRGILVNERF